jgi:hypothetical protein
MSKYYSRRTCVSSDLLPPYCAPDLHVVTEKEWQESQEHSRALERAYKQLVCGLMDYKGTLSIDEGKTTTQCASLKPPDMSKCKDLGHGMCFLSDKQ